MYMYMHSSIKKSFKEQKTKYKKFKSSKLSDFNKNSKLECN